MKNKKLIIFIILFTFILIISIFYIIFNSKMAKKINFGNNKSSQEIVSEFLNISSYEATVKIDVKSNKNNNKYILKKQYISPNISTQEVIEPKNIAGIKIIKEGNNLKIENTKLNLSSIFENYNYISENDLDLECFIEQYKNQKEQKIEEKDNQIILKIKGNKNKNLYIDKNTAKPIKMELKDNNKNESVYILYNEVTLNNIKKENLIK